MYICVALNSIFIKMYVSYGTKGVHLVVLVLIVKPLFIYFIMRNRTEGTQQNTINITVAK